MTPEDKEIQQAIYQQRAELEGTSVAEVKRRDQQEEDEELVFARNNAEAMRAPIRRMLEAGMDCYDSVYDCPFMLRVYEQEKSKIGTITPKIKAQK